MTGPAAGRQLTLGASAPLERLSSHFAIAFCFFLTYFSTALPIASVHGDRLAACTFTTPKTSVATTPMDRIQFDMRISFSWRALRIRRQSTTFPATLTR